MLTLVDAQRACRHWLRRAQAGDLSKSARSYTGSVSDMAPMDHLAGTSNQEFRLIHNRLSRTALEPQSFRGVKSSDS
jgi:hypothetical protein